MLLHGRVFRVRVGLLCLTIFLLGSGVAPVLDAWVHAKGGTAAAAEIGHGCVLCLAGGTPYAPNLETSRLEVRVSTPAAGMPVGHARVDISRTEYLRPPSRAPPSC
jgi:hypothetical protein